MHDIKRDYIKNTINSAPLSIKKHLYDLLIKPDGPFNDANFRGGVSIEYPNWSIALYSRENLEEAIRILENELEGANEFA